MESKLSSGPEIEYLILKFSTPEYLEKRLRKKQKIAEEIEKQQKTLSRISEAKIARAQTEQEQLVKNLELERDLSRTIVHVDMDSFGISVEMRDRPELRDVPASMCSSGILNSVNYRARAFGIRTKISDTVGLELCPHLKMIGPNEPLYIEVSNLIKSVMIKFDPNSKMIEKDEAYLDITELVEERKIVGSIRVPRKLYSGSCQCNWPRPETESKTDIMDQKFTESDTNSTKITKFNCQNCSNESILTEDFVTFGTGAEEVVKEIRFQIQQNVGIIASAGIAPNVLLSKLCAPLNKPNGQYFLPPNRVAILNFLSQTATENIPGIGKLQSALLKNIGIENCGDIYPNLGRLSFLYGERGMRNLKNVYLGLSINRTDHPTSFAKSVLFQLKK